MPHYPLADHWSRLAMAALFTTTALLCAGSLLNADVVGVLDSEHNRERYPNVDQDALTARLAELQIRYRVIHDAEVQDAAQLEGVAAVATAHTYCVSEAVGNALAEFVRKGGSVLWVDGPVFAESTAFCALFGITPGGKQACHYGRAFQTKCLQPEALLAQLDAPAKIEMFVGNAFMPESVDAGGVVYEATGEARLAGQSWEEKQERSVPAVISRKTGQGNALLLNWMALRNREPEVKAWVDRLILKFLPESVVNQDYRLSAAPGQRSYVVQPAPVTWSLDYEPLRELGGGRSERSRRHRIHGRRCGWQVYVARAFCAARGTLGRAIAQRAILRGRMGGGGEVARGTPGPVGAPAESQQASEGLCRQLRGDAAQRRRKR